MQYMWSIPLIRQSCTAYFLIAISIAFFFGICQEKLLYQSAKKLLPAYYGLPDVDIMVKYHQIGPLAFFQ